MKLNKTAIAIALSSVLGLATIGGAHAQAGASSGGAAGASAGTSAGSSGQTGSNSNSMTNPGARRDAMGNGSMSSMHGANGSTTANNGRYHWWQKEWWQQHAQNGRVTRQQYMDQMSRRWDSMDTSRQGYLTPDQLERAFGDETTVAPGGNGPESANPAAGPAGGMTRGSATTGGMTGGSSTTSGTTRQ